MTMLSFRVDDLNPANCGLKDRGSCRAKSAATQDAGSPTPSGASSRSTDKTTGPRTTPGPADAQPGAVARRTGHPDPAPQRPTKRTTPAAI